MNFDAFCSDILNSDPMIRYTALLNKSGEKISGISRQNMTPLLNEDEQKMELYHAGQRWETRKYLDHKIGKAKYSFTEYEKIKRVTFPVDDRHLLLVSMEPNANHLEVVDKILKIILKNNLPDMQAK